MSFTTFAGNSMERFSSLCLRVSVVKNFFGRETEDGQPTHGHSKRELLRAMTVCGTLFALSCAGGCQTLAGKTPPPIESPCPSFLPRVEHTVGEFTFSMGGAEAKPSSLDGRLLTNEIMCAWKEDGYVRDAQFVDSGAFSGTADYNLTLSGSQRNDSSFWAELLNALTLMFIPYTVTQEYDLHYILEDVKTGTKFNASIQGADKTQIEIFLLLTLPITQRGHRTTMQRMGTHLYDQFYRQGAFHWGNEVPAASDQSLAERAQCGARGRYVGELMESGTD